jgi:hypothetical protein
MNPRNLLTSGEVRGLLVGVAIIAVAPATAEILIWENGKPSVVANYDYPLPAFNSIVFASPEARQMAILPPGPAFIQQPGLWGGWGSVPPPPARVPDGVNASAHPSNRDVVSYNLQRAHNFRQDLYNRDTYIGLSTGAPSGYGYNGYTYYGAFGPAYPAYPPSSPVNSGGFNQSSRPSNRDATSYHLNRASRFSMDAYKGP